MAAAFSHQTTCRLVYDTPQRAHTVTRAVDVERGEIADDRSATTVAREGRTVRVTVRARDLVALRAGLNTWLRLFDTAEATVDAAV